MYLTDLWYCIALEREITNAPRRRVLCDQPFVLFRGGSGFVVALEDRCGHRQAPLSRGCVIGDEIQCLYHGYQFAPDGTCTHVPHQEGTPRTADVQSYAVVERWGYVWLWWGDASRADPATIPHLPWTAETTRRTVYFNWTINANFQLMADNLLDISHADFLHRSSIGSKAGMKNDGVKANMRCWIDADRAHLERRLVGVELGGVATKWAGTTAPVTRINTQMWEPPNTIHTVLEFKNDEAHRTIHMAHIMTPETATTCHYFMNWTRDFGLDNIGYPTDSDVQREQTAVVAAEDIPMVEAQQANLNVFRQAQDAPARQDIFIVNAHRVLTGMYRSANVPVPRELQRVGREREPDRDNTYAPA